MWLLVTLVAVPVVFCAISWAFVSAARVWGQDDPIQVARALQLSGQKIPTWYAVGVDADGLDSGAYERAYFLVERESAGIPLAWHSELWVRRN